MDEQFDLFKDIADELEVKKEEPKKKETKVKAKAKAEAKPKEEPKKPVTVDKQWIVAYAGRLIDVPEDDMTIERLHQYMEVDFPELSKSRSSCALDEEAKIITFAPNGTKKG